MLIGKRICCIVTARKNSKGINNKNLKIIDGNPLIYYPIRAAINSKFIDKILFNSDSDVMIKKAKSYGAEISFKRPKKLALSKTKSVDVLIHHIKKERLDKKYDYLILLEPTSPFTTSSDLKVATRKLIKKSKIADSLVSVSDGTIPNSNLKFEIRKDLLFPLEKKKFYTTRRQDMPKNYFIDGSLYITKIKTLMESKSFIQKKTTFIKMKKYKTFQIDDEIDFEIVKFLMKKFKYK